MDMRIKEEQQYTKVASLQLSLVSLSKLVNFPGAGLRIKETALLVRDSAEAIYGFG